MSTENEELDAGLPRRTRRQNLCIFEIWYVDEAFEERCTEIDAEDEEQAVDWLLENHAGERVRVTSVEKL